MYKGIKKLILKGIKKDTLDHWYRVVKYHLRKNIILQLTICKKEKKENLFCRQHKNACWILGTPTYGNLGDHAIAYAQEAFIKEYFFEYDSFEMDEEKTLQYLSYLKKIIKKGDIIFLQGGGNMGRKYYYQEKLRQDVIKKFPHNRIVVFPQTIDYGNSYADKRALNKSKKIYNKHSQLILVAREKKSYQVMKKEYTFAKVILTPDIVLSLTVESDFPRKNQALLCWRNDIEKSVTEGEKEEYCKKILEKNIKVVYSDTVAEYDITTSQREVELQRKWKEFRQSRFVITDRLHGMIFATITGTPCIAINNSNQKVQRCYEWLKEIKEIHFVKTNEEFDKALDQIVMEQEGFSYKPDKERYKVLIECVKDKD